MSRAQNQEPNNYNRKKNGKRLLVNKTIDSLASLGLELPYNDFNKVYLHDGELSVGISIPGTILNQHNTIEYEMTERENTATFMDILQNNKIGKDLFNNISKIQYNDYMDQLNIYFECDSVRFPNFITLLSTVKTCTAEFDNTLINGIEQNSYKELKQNFGADMYVQPASRDDFPVKLLLRNVFMTRKFKAGLSTYDSVLDAIENKLIDSLKLDNRRHIKLTRWKFKNKPSETALLELKSHHSIDHIIDLIKKSNAHRVYGYAPFKMAEFKNKNEAYYIAKMHSAVIRLKKIKDQQKEQQEAIRLAGIAKEEEKLHEEYALEQEKIQNGDKPPILNGSHEAETDKTDIKMNNNNNINDIITTKDGIDMTENDNNNNTTEIEIEIIKNITNNKSNNNNNNNNGITSPELTKVDINSTPLGPRNKTKSRINSTTVNQQLENDLAKDPNLL